MARVTALSSERDIATYERAPFPSPLDLVVTSLLAQLSSVPLDARQEIGQHLTRQQGIALWTFAERTAQEAVRRRDPGLVGLGLRALVLQVGHPDPRDIWPSVAPLYRATELIGSDPTSLFDDAAQFATGDTSEFVATFPQRSAEDRRIEKWQFREEGEGGSFQFFSTAPRITDPEVEPLRRLIERQGGDWRPD
jgi:hypothetical protein